MENFPNARNSARKYGNPLIDPPDTEQARRSNVSIFRTNAIRGSLALDSRYEYDFHEFKKIPAIFSVGIPAVFIPFHQLPKNKFSLRPPPPKKIEKRIFALRMKKA